MGGAGGAMSGAEMAGVRPRALGNTAWNREYHDWYAERWRADVAFRSVTGDRPGQPEVVASTAAIGTEWAPPEDLAEVVDRFIVPYAAGARSVLEVGPGGGRVARRVSDVAGTNIVGADVSPRMLVEAARFTDGSVLGVQTDGARLPLRNRSIGFAYAFDVLVHTDLHVMFRLLVELARVVHRDGLITVHTANLETATGWERFSEQTEYSPEAHFFVTPSTVRLLLHRAGFELVDESQEEPANFYLARDYIAVARRTCP